MKKGYRVLLYYCYTHIADAENFRNEHHEFCLEKKLLGRIIIANEGINGTVSGLKDDCDAYMLHLKNDHRFEHTVFKVEEHDKHAFQKLHVRFKKEIVNSSITNIMPNKNPDNYIEPADFLRIKDNDDVVVVDVRSNYEHKLGRFKNSVTLDINNFREFPNKVGDLTKYKGKKIITVCTGGVKCEKASLYLRENGFPDVYQLHGGIIQYGIDTDGRDFEGKCYVFDNRISKDINSANPSVISECFVCNELSDHVVNCVNEECNKHVPICNSCLNYMEGACSKECSNKSKKRKYNGTGYYTKNMNGYNPYKGSFRSSA